MKYDFAFYVSEKTLSNNWATTIQRSAAVHGDVVHIEKQSDFLDDSVVPDKYHGGCNIGLARACKRIMGAYLKAGRHFLFFDKGYWGRNLYWRVAVDAWQPNRYFRRFARSTDRLERLEKEVGFIYKNKFEADAEAPILFAGSCQNYANFTDLGNVNDYNLYVLRKLRANTLRRLIYRPNPSWYRKHNDEFRPIHEEVKNTELSVGGEFSDVVSKCHLMVTHGTGAAVTATQLGIPSMVIGDGVARSIALAGPQWGEIETPYFPKHKERWQFYADLAYCQWTTAEFESGKAWQEIRDILSFLEGVYTEASIDDIIRQYKLMHASKKYFRGIGTVNYRDNILELVQKTSSISILDYGSGKGEQYQEPYSLNQYWGTSIRCYDPGIPEFEELPGQAFDGVVCCDVMEHIPAKAVGRVLQEIFSLARKWVFFVITTVPAKKILPDGRNCHVTLRDEAWWRDQLAKASGGIHYQLITKGDDGEGE